MMGKIRARSLSFEKNQGRKEKTRPEFCPRKKEGQAF
jgi:hypothetical protein